MILRIDDTDVDRNTKASLDSIFDGLRWLDLGWDEEYRQSDRLDLHRQGAQRIFDRGCAYRDFTPAVADVEGTSLDSNAWRFHRGMGAFSSHEREPRGRTQCPCVPVS